MKTILLKTIHENIHGTFGVMIGMSDQMILCVTLEKNWRNNEQNISCIPPGLYHCEWNPKQGVFEVLDVPGRTEIQIEGFNYESESLGCIGVATTLTYRGILNCEGAMIDIRDYTDCEPFYLKVER